MQTNLFSFELLDRLIARNPPETRGDDRLMVLDRHPKESEISGKDVKPLHQAMADLPRFIDEGTVMVFNDTRVRKARVFGRNLRSGGRGEFLFLDSSKPGEWDCLVDKAKKRKIGQEWEFPGGIIGTIVASPATDRRLMALNPAPDESWFEDCGHIPLPPYMKRPDNPEDAERYQTIYARRIGSAAAPTAGLHFTDETFQALRAKGVEIVHVTLNVGLGSFAPIREEDISQHSMHSERFEIPESTNRAVLHARQEGRKVLAVGTTVVRSLEAAWNGRELNLGAGSTDLFIYPGYSFKVVDQMFTNFHTPKSSLLMLVSAFCGRERLLQAYQIAMDREYRFFSYGDAMLIR